MLFLFVVFATGCLSLLTLGLAEQRRHYANLHRIPARVLINGIRGKSSITRLCAGALRGGGLVTVAKTTGTAARFIHPDGSEEPVYRKFGIANVVEQIGIVRRASAYRPDVLAIECMAVQPDLQEINQSKLIQSTIGVLCNVREDHLAEMGPTLDDVARSLSRSMPVGGICVTAEKERLHILREEAARRECELVSVDPESVTDEQMAGFSWITFKENVAIALAVADLLGVNRQSALAGMWAAAPDPGVLSVQRYQLDGLQLRFANIFAANDPESTLMNIEQLLGNRAIERPLHVVINCRPDRIERNGQMGALIPKIAPVRVVLIGEATRSARAAIPADWSGEVTDLGGRQAPETLLAGALEGMSGTASLVTIGNIHGQGEVLLEQLATLPQAPAGTSLEPTGSQPAAHSQTAVQSRPAGSQSPESHTATGLQPVDRSQPFGSQSPNPSTATGLHPVSPPPTPEPWHDSQPAGPQSLTPQTATGLRPISPQPTPEPWHTNGGQPAGSQSPEPWTATGLQPAPEPWSTNSSQPSGTQSPTPHTATGLHPITPQPTPEPWFTNDSEPAGPQTPEPWTATGLPPAAEPRATTDSQPSRPQSSDFPTAVGLEPVGPWPVKTKSPTGKGLQPADPAPTAEPRPASKFRPSPVPRSSSASDTRPLPRIPDASTHDPRSDP